MINIHETFQETLQGEGYHTGTACDFIRTYGCPVGCYFCDTGYEPNGDYYNKKIPKSTPNQSSKATLVALNISTTGKKILNALMELTFAS